MMKPMEDLFRLSMRQDLLEEFNRSYDKGLPQEDIDRNIRYLKRQLEEKYGIPFSKAEGGEIFKTGVGSLSSSMGREMAQPLGEIGARGVDSMDQRRRSREEVDQEDRDFNRRMRERLAEEQERDFIRGLESRDFNKEMGDEQLLRQRERQMLEDQEKELLDSLPLPEKGTPPNIEGPYYPNKSERMKRAEELNKLLQDEEGKPPYSNEPGTPGYERLQREMEIMNEIMRLLEEDVGDLFGDIGGEEERRKYEDQRRQFLGEKEDGRKQGFGSETEDGMFSLDTLTIDGEPVAVINFKDGEMLTFYEIGELFRQYKTAPETNMGPTTMRMIREFLEENNPTYAEFINHFFLSRRLADGGEVETMGGIGTLNETAKNMFR
jgi:hypothetical protein